MTQEVLAEDSRQTHPDVRYTVTYYRKKFKLEIALKYIFLGHGFPAHHHEDLPALKSLGFKEILLHSCNDSFKFGNIVAEFF